MSTSMSFVELSRFYHNLAALDHAGLTYLKAFEGFQRTEKDKERFFQYQFMIGHLKGNRPLATGLKFSKLIPVLDVPLLKAAEDSGRLVEILKTLSKKYNDAALAEKEIRSQLIQPYFTFIVALFVPAFPELFAGKISLAVYLRNSMGTLIVVTGIFYGFYEVWMRSFYELKMARLFHLTFYYLPFFNGLMKRVALEKFSSGLAIMLDSGMDLFESLNQSALCSADPHIQSAINQMIPMIRQGVDIGRVFQAHSYFSSDLVNSISMGADSGKLPEFLRRYSETVQDEINVRLKIVTKFIPLTIYFGVAVYVASIVTGIFSGHMQQVIDAVGP